MLPLRDGIRLTRIPLVTVALILANVVVYLVSIGSGGSIVDGPSAATVVGYGAIPYEFAHLASHCGLAAGEFAQQVLCSGQPGVSGAAGSQPPTPITAFSAMFLHANLLALAVNMVVLAVFGATVEDTLGRGRFLAFYVLGALAALALSIAVSPGSTTPLIGSSGALAAVLGAYILLYPRARILTLLLPLFFLGFIEPPAWLLICVWLCFDAVLGALGVITPLGGGPGIAYYAHLGGFAFGLLALRAFMRGRAASYGPLRIA